MISKELLSNEREAENKLSEAECHYCIESTAEQMPFSYPCIIVWYIEGGGPQAWGVSYIYSFVYLNDFDDGNTKKLIKGKGK